MSIAQIYFPFIHRKFSSTMIMNPGAQLSREHGFKLRNLVGIPLSESIFNKFHLLKKRGSCPSSNIFWSAKHKNKGVIRNTFCKCAWMISQLNITFLNSNMKIQKKETFIPFYILGHFKCYAQFLIKLNIFVL